LMESLAKCEWRQAINSNPRRFDDDGIDDARGFGIKNNRSGHGGYGYQTISNARLIEYPPGAVVSSVNG